ncbi:MAG TPA: PhzF family phenazine biosynthesis protein [Xanthobacteraceae bacterium]|nr:PhzF family phenazine biosynthesis protein [Xanthobacteraceae bacterium]
MHLPIYQVDAFAEKLFGGNPAAICPLTEWLPDATMQAIAAENNLAETAFFVREGADYALRWFTPAVEVDLCGHATLASAHVVFSFLEPGRERVNFRTLKAGTLTVARRGDMLMMDFPARPATAVDPPPGLLAALGGSPREVLKARDHMVVYGSAAEVAALKPDFAALGRLDCWAAIATAPGEDGTDFVSRFFAPRQGIDEDPATGSSHCTLVPYWAARLGKRELQARQLSRRVGTLTCALNGDRVAIGGRTVLYLEGKITV